MDGSRIEQAIQRIEAAASRITAASGKLGATPSDDSALAAHHQALKSEVANTLKDLDQLIGRIEA